MLRALLLLACTAKVAAFAQTPPGCVNVDPDGLQSAYTADPTKTLVMRFEGEDVEEVPIASCVDVAAGGGCDDESLAGFCCASCALPQRMTYGFWGKVKSSVKSWWRRVRATKPPPPSPSPPPPPSPPPAYVFTSSAELKQAVDDWITNENAAKTK